MNVIKEQHIVCPYCGEGISILIDCSIEQQDYIEDCQVCCKPISLSISCDDGGEPNVEARDENE